MLSIHSMSLSSSTPTANTTLPIPPIPTLTYLTNLLQPTSGPSPLPNAIKANKNHTNSPLTRLPLPHSSKPIILIRKSNRFARYQPSSSWTRLKFLPLLPRPLLSPFPEFPLDPTISRCPPRSPCSGTESSLLLLDALELARDRLRLT